MKINLGCGVNRIQGYLNVDWRDPCDLKLDLSELPWPWETASADEVLMLDFLEHFPYRQTDALIQETWRVLRVGGHVDIQVPDFKHCALAALDMPQYLCNFCGADGRNISLDADDERVCGCGKSRYDIADAAIKRLYGGQDYEGNWHYNAFTKEILERKLKLAGFDEFEYLEKYHMWKNWSIKIRAIKQRDAWD